MANKECCTLWMRHTATSHIGFYGFQHKSLLLNSWIFDAWAHVKTWDVSLRNLLGLYHVQTQGKINWNNHVAIIHSPQLGFTVRSVQCCKQWTLSTIRVSLQYDQCRVASNVHFPQFGFLCNKISKLLQAMYTFHNSGS